MTRQKKTRSLSRIHKVKTGNIAKLKREAGSDRQSSKRIKGRKQASAYEKFLAENPDAKQKALAEQQKDNKPKPKAHEKKAEPRQQPREKGLLDQLDSKDFNDIY